MPSWQNYVKRYMAKITKEQYEFALARIEELLPIGKPTVAQLIQLSLDEKNMSQKQLATEIGVSPSRISDYVSGRAEPTLKIARLLCVTLGISPSAMLGY